jgi:hypothetical protein
MCLIADFWLVSTEIGRSHMRAGIDTAPAIAAVDERRILDLEQRSIRISSPTFQEGEIADLYAHARRTSASRSK